MTRTILTPLMAASWLALGCAHDPSKELVSARTTYEAARTGPAGTLAKTEVYDAKKALTAAEQAHDRKSGSDEEVDLAYVALRKSDYAIAHAQYLQYRKDGEAATADYLSTLERQKESAESRLETSEDDLATSNEDLAKSRAARDALEKQLLAALASLSDMAKVDQGTDRTVITLNGAVLFRTNETQLLPIAQEKLAQVAEVLEQYGSEYPITVVGHTDSSGSDDHNQRLSQGRADAVRSYLVSRGVDAGTVQSVGHGESQPIASNDTTEGRANNRRVEIIVDRAPSGSRATPAR